MATITSVHNPHIQRVRELLNQKSARDSEKAFVVEGVRLCEEALIAGCQPTEVYCSPTLSERGQKFLKDAITSGAEIFEIPQNVMDSLSATETSQGILMVLPQTSKTPLKSADFALVLDQVRDPGNMGTILRSAAATGVQVVFLPPGNADVFSPKVVRSGMGAHFRLCLVQGDWPGIIQYCKKHNQPALNLMLAESGGGVSCWQANLKQPLALVIGGEADGASPEARQVVDTLLHIPMPGKFESLNASVAAGILLFEVVRQRSAA
jgi:TrmH family RNA methyltransferase